MIQALEAHATTAGPASVLKLREVPTPSPGRNEVLIAVEAAGVAFGDIMLRLGRHPSFKPPITPGWTCFERMESFPAMRGELDAGAKTVYPLLLSPGR